jgi:two-component system, chemotaxis family, response regulator Rcp1
MSSDRDMKPVEILLIEDNPVDTMMTREALADAKVFNNLHTVEDGEQALDFLYRKGKYTEAPKPDLILLDLNLPKKDGREILAEIKDDSALSHIPVIILTTSESDADILNTYQQHANCFITKPVDMEQFIEVVKSIEEFWFTVVKLPNPENEDACDVL